MQQIDPGTMDVLLEMQELCEFFLQRYSRDYHLQIPKSGYEAQYLEWHRKRELLYALITWLEHNVLTHGL